MVLASAQPHADHTSAIIGLAAIALMLGPMLAAALWSKLARVAAHRRLRSCPLCRADAIRDVRAEAIDTAKARVWLQCGECATWRRVETTHHAFTWEVKTFERDRQLISDQAQRLCVERRERALEAFVATLEHDVVGADDFIALTLRSPTARP
ncbi:hypothetical protein [Solirubrobacter soli]|uniref:hypothetical protein n=1 Tax=Solirubrobacter soli TaxID=363832 RepID=UPI0004291DA9|nr:hypothetical protein [Solirubrobacter soli]